MDRKNLWQGWMWAIAGGCVAAAFLPNALRYGGIRLFLYWTLHIGSRHDFTRDERIIGLGYQGLVVFGLLAAFYGIAVVWIYRRSGSPLGLETRYAVTNKRVMLLNAVPGQRFAVFSLSEVNPEIKTHNDDGSGNLALEGPETDIGRVIMSLPKDVLDKIPADSLERVQDSKMPPTFMNIRDVGTVRDLVLQLKHSPR